jgi:transcriptional regulator with XRE-family HTH domain
MSLGDPYTLGGRIKLKRKMEGRNQTDLAVLLGVSLPTITRWEVGKVTHPDQGRMSYARLEAWLNGPICPKSQENNGADSGAVAVSGAQA